MAEIKRHMPELCGKFRRVGKGILCGMRKKEPYADAEKDLDTDDRGAVCGVRSCAGRTGKNALCGMPGKSESQNKSVETAQRTEEQR